MAQITQASISSHLFFIQSTKNLNESKLGYTTSAKSYGTYLWTLPLVHRGHPVAEWVGDWIPVQKVPRSDPTTHPMGWQCVNQ